MSERLRLFVALDLPARVRSELAAWCEAAGPAGVRRVPASRMHAVPLAARLQDAAREEQWNGIRR